MLQHHPFSEITSVITSTSKITSNCPGGPVVKAWPAMPMGDTGPTPGAGRLHAHGGRRSNPWCRKTACPRGSLALASQLLRLCPKACQLQLLQPQAGLLNPGAPEPRSATRSHSNEKPPSTASRENPRAAMKTQPKPTTRTKKPQHYERIALACSFTLYKWNQPVCLLIL